jgi:hypothetical protein
MKTTQLRPHKVLGRPGHNGDSHALCFTTGEFANIIFTYTDVNFKEDTENDKLVVGFEYYVHDVPKECYGYNKEAFEKELGDFVIQLLYYGLERDKLGFIDDQENRTDHPFESNSQ